MASNPARLTEELSWSQSVQGSGWKLPRDPTVDTCHLTVSSASMLWLLGVFARVLGVQQTEP